MRTRIVAAAALLFSAGAARSQQIAPTPLPNSIASYQPAIGGVLGGNNVFGEVITGTGTFSYQPFMWSLTPPYAETALGLDPGATAGGQIPEVFAADDLDAVGLENGDAVVWNLANPSALPQHLPRPSPTENCEANAVRGSFVMGTCATVGAVAWDMVYTTTPPTSLPNGGLGTASVFAADTRYIYGQISGSANNIAAIWSSIDITQFTVLTGNYSSGMLTTLPTPSGTSALYAGLPRYQGAQALGGNGTLAWGVAYDTSNPDYPLVDLVWDLTASPITVAVLAPIVLGGTSQYAQIISLSGNQALSTYNGADSYPHVFLFDITDPQNPSKMTFLADNGGESNGYAISGNIVFGGLGPVEIDSQYGASTLAQPGSGEYQPATNGNYAFWDLSTAPTTPAATAIAPSQVIYSPTGAPMPVTLDGSASTGAASYTWTVPNAVGFYGAPTVLSTSATVPLTLAVGSYDYVLTVTDSAGNPYYALSQITVLGGSATPDTICDPRAVSTQYTPSDPVGSANPSDAWGTLMYEDSWPSNGDLDFNDQLVAYNYVSMVDSLGNTTALQATYNVLAEGAIIHNGLRLRLNVSPSLLGLATIAIGNAAPVPVTQISGDNSQIDLVILDDTRSVFGDATGFINTAPGGAGVQGQTVTLTLFFTEGVALPGLAPYDVYLAQTSATAHEIHLSNYGPTPNANLGLFDTLDDNTNLLGGPYYVNKVHGMPFGLNVPELIAWPEETDSLSTLYPEVMYFASSGGHTGQNWYLFPTGEDLWTTTGGVTPTPALAGAQLIPCQ